MDIGLRDGRFADRLISIGAGRLLDVCKRAELLAGHKNASVWWRAIFDEVNKGLRNKFVLKGGAE
jgi:alcohol dehydrogenase class IV